MLVTIVFVEDHNVVKNLKMTNLTDI